VTEITQIEAHPMARSATQARRRSVRCPVCKKRFKVNSRGRPPNFCSRSCRQRAYEQRRWSRPHPVELLARDIDTARVRDVIRQEVREALLAAGIILPPPAPKPKRRGPPLRLIDK
jgi:tRNA(Ile2) C34 agmatinyltransferase TiaS